jgi:hypothetical protein
MIELIPYLLIKKADPYLIKELKFIYEGEENPEYLTKIGCATQRYECAKTNIPFFEIQSPIKCERTFIGDAISKNRLDVLEILDKFSPTKIDWNKFCFLEGIPAILLFNLR